MIRLMAEEEGLTTGKERPKEEQSQPEDVTHGNGTPLSRKRALPSVD